MRFGRLSPTIRAMRTHDHAAATGYPVVWQTPDGERYVGILLVGARSVRLDGRSHAGARFRWELSYTALTTVRIGRAPAEQLDGLPGLVVERPDSGPMLIGAAGGIGTLHEIADRLAASAPRP
jgi:hypothetical protein